MTRIASTFLGEAALTPLRSVAEPVLHAARQFLALRLAISEPSFWKNLEILVRVVI